MQATWKKSTFTTQWRSHCNCTSPYYFISFTRFYRCKPTEKLNPFYEFHPIFTRFWVESSANWKDISDGFGSVAFVETSYFTRTLHVKHNPVKAQRLSTFTTIFCRFTKFPYSETKITTTYKPVSSEPQTTSIFWSPLKSPKVHVRLATDGKHTGDMSLFVRRNISEKHSDPVKNIKTHRFDVTIKLSKSIFHVTCGWNMGNPGKFAMKHAIDIVRVWIVCVKNIVGLLQSRVGKAGQSVHVLKNAFSSEEPFQGKLTRWEIHLEVPMYSREVSQPWPKRVDVNSVMSTRFVKSPCVFTANKRSLMKSHVWAKHSGAKGLGQ